MIARMFRHLRARVISGVLVLTPLAVTFVVLRFFYRLFVGYVRPIARLMPRQGLPEYAVNGLAVVALLAFLYGVGALMRMMVGRRLVGWGEAVLNRIPVVKSVYSWTKSLIELLASRDRTAFKSVVLVDFPRPGCRALGFVGGEGRTFDGRRQVRVFLPTSPNPTSGYLLLVDESEVTRLDMTIEEGVRMVVSGGVLVPPLFDGGDSPPPATEDQGHGSIGTGTG